MSCYIEDIETPFGKPRKCIVRADTPEELSIIANSLNIWPSEIELPNIGNPFFAIPFGKRRTAIALGCVER